MDLINIISLKWGTKYGDAYVNKLYSAVKRNTTLPFKFHCFTDDGSRLNAEIKVHSLPFGNKLDSWWNKLWLFNPNLPIRSKIFYIDLDTVITGNIDDLLRADGFIVLRDFYASMAQGVSITDIGSGLMLWDTTKGQPYPEIWNKFIQNPRSVVNSLHPHGDQRWIQQFVSDRKYWQDVVPNQVVSFKTHCIKGMPKDARVVCYHGTPSIPESIRSQSQGWRGALIQPATWVSNHWQ